MAGTFRKVVGQDNLGMSAEIASNSLALEPGDAVKVASGFIAAAGAGDTIEGVSVTQKTFASDNQTVAKAAAIYTPVDANEEYELPIAFGTTLQFDGDLVTSNTINLTVNGTAMTEVTFSASNAATLALIATQLETDFPTLIADAVAVGDDDAVKITPQPWVTITLGSIVVAAGAGQASGSQVDTVTQARTNGYYDITSGQYADGYTYSASTGQLQLTKYIDQTVGWFRIVNA